MPRIIVALAALLLFTFPVTPQADPSDINAASRGVVRVVIMGRLGDEIYPVSHGTGFAVSPNKIITNAHVIREALVDNNLRIGIVPSDGAEASFAVPVSVSPRNDLALLEVLDNPRLPPLTLSGPVSKDSGEVTAVGYPMNVDRAQGLSIEDIFSSQPPVKSRGALAGARPSRDFDTILHTAPIAAGNSGGPLLDPCGRVVGVNSFGADSTGSDAEFFFAVSMREVLPFLKANGINVRVNEQPCRSLAEIDAEERARMEQEQAAEQARIAAYNERQRQMLEKARIRAGLEVQQERENAMMLAFIALLIGAMAASYAWQATALERFRARWLGDEDGDQEYSDAAAEEDADNGNGEAVTEEDDEDEEVEEAPYSHTTRLPKSAAIALFIALVALIAAAALWFTRPGLDEIERKISLAMSANATGSDTGANSDKGMQSSATETTAGSFACTLDPARSRITGTPPRSLDFGWSEDGCVNGRTQYGFSGGDWSRILVPNQDAAVSVNSFDPASNTFRTDRYLLSRDAMAQARAARSKYTAPKCGSKQDAVRLGELQGAIMEQLPDRPNERLVYRCEAKE